jgi:uncharacterized membrane protein
MHAKNRIHCILCNQERPAELSAATASLRPSIAEDIRQRHAALWRSDGRICRRCLDVERSAYVLDQLEHERGELSEIEAEVARKAAVHMAVAEHIDTQFGREMTFGQRIADQVAAIGGSWPFVIGFCAVLLTWVAFNSLVLRTGAFDPYPYILLNLVLSCLAALQAPVIIMSQNRAAARDRLEADEDYKINLKAELEIASLHDKIDHLLHVQWERMVEIQQAQIELLNELASRR